MRISGVLLERREDNPNANNWPCPHEHNAVFRCFSFVKNFR
jgi:hypothetical protein